MVLARRQVSVLLHCSFGRPGLANPNWDVLVQCGSTRRSLQPTDKTTPHRHFGAVHWFLEPKDQTMPSARQLTRAVLRGLRYARYRRAVQRPEPILAQISSLAPRLRCRRVRVCCNGQFEQSSNLLLEYPYRSEEIACEPNTRDQERELNEESSKRVPIGFRPRVAFAHGSTLGPGQIQINARRQSNKLSRSPRNGQVHLPCPGDPIRLN